MKVWKLVVMLVLAGSAAGLLLSSLIIAVLSTGCLIAFFAFVVWGANPRNNGNEHFNIAVGICSSIILFLLPMAITATVVGVAHVHLINWPAASWLLR